MTRLPVLVVLPLLASAAIAQVTTFDRITVDDTRLLRSTLHYQVGWLAPHVSGSESGVSMQYYGDFPWTDIHLRAFDPWGRPTLPPTFVATAARAFPTPSLARLSDRNLVTWCDQHPGCIPRAVVTDLDGVALTPVLELGDEFKGGFKNIVSDGSRIGLTFAGGADNCSKCAILFQEHDLLGALIAPAVVVATPPPFPISTIVFNPTAAFLPDGSIGVLYNQGNHGAIRYDVRYRRILPDQTLTNPVVLPMMSDTRGYVARFLSDGTWLIWWSGYPDSSVRFVRRFSAMGEPLGTPVQVDPNGLPWIAPDGRFVHIWERNGNTEIRLKMYEADGSIAVNWFDPTPSTPNRPTHAFPVDYGPYFSSTLQPGFRFAMTWFAMPVNQQVIDVYWTTIRPLIPGDLNADGVLNNFDIDAFVLAKVNRPSYHAAYPGVPPEVVDLLGDMNDDGAFNNFDIDPFVEAILGSP
ncbi:MAG: hypothetical protein IPM64_02830 [Phycisphaerales bacterium]|nr:hypothetical protein [Phycisphaerales bacterium]